MTDKQPTSVNSELHCEHCGRNFIRASSAIKHLCERKQRWLNRDLVSSRLGYNAWLKFYEKTSASRRVRDFQEFIKSNYYTAFVRWGHYCASIDAVNPPAFLLWLLRAQISIDQWAQDRHYNSYLKEWLGTEDPLDAVNRAFRWADDYAEALAIPAHDCVRYGNANRIIHAITTGKLSAWVLYNSASGHEFLSNLLPEQVEFLSDYIDPQRWNILFRRHADSVKDVQAVLAAAGW